MTVETIKEAEKQLENKKIIFATACGLGSCEEQLKEKISVKSLNSPLAEEQPKLKKKQKCFACGKKAQYWGYFGKSY